MDETPHPRRRCFHLRAEASAAAERSGCQVRPLAWCLGWGKSGRMNPIQVGDGTPWPESGLHSPVFARRLRGLIGRRISTRGHRSRPSQTTSGTIAKAATESAHGTCQKAFTTSPVKAIKERYPHSADSAASALRAALSVTADSRRFSLASRGMHTAAAIRMAIPRGVGFASLYPSNAMTETATTQAARAKSSSPAMRAARRAACSCATLVRNLQNTTTADRSSIALSPPNARSAGLRARHAARRDMAASTLIQTIVIA